MQVRSVPRRSCAKKGDDTYVDFLFSDDEGSDSSGEEAQDSGDDETYDATTEGAPTFDKKKGENSWIGRRIVKNFGDQGDFAGIVYGADADADNKGFRLFLVHYFDDPDDGEAMWAEELFQ